MIGSPVHKPTGKMDDDVQYWFAQIDRGIRLRKFTQEDRWDENEDADDLKQWQGAEGDMDGDDETTINKIGSWIQTHRASLAFNNPRVKLTPKRAAGWEPIPVPEMGPDGTPKIDPMTGQVVVRYIKRYELRQALLNEVIAAPLMGFKQTISRLVKAGGQGYGILKSGYRPVFETYHADNPSEQMVKVTADGLDFSAYQMNPVTGLPAIDDNGDLIPKSSIPIWEDWFIDWVHYRHMIIDPDGGNDFMKHSWVAQEIIRPLEDVKNDPLFKNTKDLKGSGDFWSEDEHQVGWMNDSGLTDESIRDRAEQVRLFELWDLKNDRLIVLADGHGEYLRNGPAPNGAKFGPFSFYRPNEVFGKTECFYPRPKYTDLLPVAKEYNKARRQQSLAMKRSTRKLITKEGTLNREAMDALTNDEDMAVVNVKVDANYGIGDAIQAFAPPPLNDAIYSNIQYTAKDFDEIAGQPGESRGVASSNTATQVNMMGQYSGVRLSFDRTVLVDCLRDAIKRLDDSIEANMTIERAVSIVGEDGQAWVGIIDPDMIVCDVDVDIDIEDMIPVDSAQQAAMKVQFAQVAGQNPWLVSDEDLAVGWGKEFGVRDVNFLKALSRAAQAQIQAAMAPAQPKVPNAPPPTNEAQAIQQMGAGMQAPAMQGAQ